MIKLEDDKKKSMNSDTMFTWVCICVLSNSNGVDTQLDTKPTHRPVTISRDSNSCPAAMRSWETPHTVLKYENDAKFRVLRIVKASMGLYQHTG